MSDSDRVDVTIAPPLLFLAALGLGSILSLALPVGSRIGSGNKLALIAGFTFVAIGFALVALSAQRFRLAGTSVVPGQPTTALVTAGPYRYTRNPIYIGFILAYFGFSIVLTSLWILLLLIPVLFILQRGVVLPEEAYLERKFGETYRKYKARVPRWL